jgi:hypothetical protein
MSGIYKLIGNASWLLGMISLIAGFLIRLFKPSGVGLFGLVTARSSLDFAGVLFLCALATLAMEAANRPETKTRG